LLGSCGQGQRRALVRFGFAVTGEFVQQIPSVIRASNQSGASSAPCWRSPSAAAQSSLVSRKLASRARGCKARLRCSRSCSARVA
jgi:hypothetical protein